MKDWLAGKKTYLLGAAGLIGTIVAWASGEVTLAQAVGAAFIALQSMFIRAGIAK